MNVTVNMLPEFKVLDFQALEVASEGRDFGE
jgi:hypothetical protein